MSSRRTVDPREVKIGSKVAIFRKPPHGSREAVKVGFVTELTTSHARVFNPRILDDRGERCDFHQTAEWFPFASKRCWMELLSGGYGDGASSN